MLMILIIVSGILIIIGEVTYKDELIQAGIGGSLILGAIAAVLLTGFPYNIDKKIELYTSENTKIEEKVKNTVQSYMQYEENTYKDLVKNAALETMLIKYPELNSNELVKSEIAVYIENSKQLKILKEKEITKSTIAWWLYLGK